MDSFLARTDSTAIDFYSSLFFEKLFNPIEEKLPVAASVSLKKPVVNLYFFHPHSARNYNYFPQKSQPIRKESILTSPLLDKYISHLLILKEGSNPYWASEVNEPQLNEMLDYLNQRLEVMPKRPIIVELLDGERFVACGLADFGILLEEELQFCLKGVLQRLNQRCQMDLDWFSCIYTFDLDKLDPFLTIVAAECEEDGKSQGIADTQKRYSGSWSQIWAYKSFSARLLAIYANISHEDAIDLLTTLAQLKLLQLEPHIQNSLLVTAHLYTPSRSLKTYIPPLNKLKNISTDKEVNIDVQNISFFNSCQRAWMSIRILQTFDVASIQTTANISQSVANQYVLQLHSTGYLRLAGKSNFSEIFANSNNYQLIRNSGTIAPFPVNRNLMYDFNTQGLYPSKLK